LVVRQVFFDLSQCGCQQAAPNALRPSTLAGKDATEDFEEIGHSRAAKEMLAKYYIGEFAVSQVSISRTQPGSGTHPFKQASLARILRCL
jgi:hypothetical protein